MLLIITSLYVQWYNCLAAICSDRLMICTRKNQSWLECSNKWMPTSAEGLLPGCRADMTSRGTAMHKTDNLPHAQVVLNTWMLSSPTVVCHLHIVLSIMAVAVMLLHILTRFSYMWTEIEKSIRLESWSQITKANMCLLDTSAQA